MSYLEQIKSTTLVRRFGWLSDYVGADIPGDIRVRLRQLAAGGSKAFLGPKIPKQNAIGYQKTWKLAVNVGKDELSDSAGLAKKTIYLAFKGGTYLGKILIGTSGI